MKRKIYAYSNDYVYDGKQYIWFSSCCYNGLLKFDVINEVIEYVKPFKDYEVNFQNLHGATRVYNNKLIFFPLLGHHISVIDLDTLNEKTVEIPNYLSTNGYYCDIATKENIFTIIPWNIKAGVYEFDVEKNEIYKNIKMSNLLGDIFENGEKNKSITTYENEILIADEYNFFHISETGNYIEHPIEINEKIDRVKKIDNIFIIFLKNSLDIYLLHQDRLVKFYNEDNSFEQSRNNLAYTNCIELYDKVYLCNYYANYTGILDFENKKIKSIKFNLESYHRIHKEKFGGIVENIILINDNIYFLPGRGNSVIVHNLTNDSNRAVSFRVDKFSDNSTKKYFFSEIDFIEEESDIELDSWLLELTEED